MLKGFKGKTPFPAGLTKLGQETGIEVVPLGTLPQKNPIYERPPGSDSHGASFLLFNNYTGNLLAKEFGVGTIRGRIRRVFVYARVQLPACPELAAYINIWSRRLDSRKSTGHLYCSISVEGHRICNDPVWDWCLCGKGCNRWAARGWVCPYVQVPDW